MQTNVFWVGEVIGKQVPPYWHGFDEQTVADGKTA
jgi:hypothetical protein